MRQSVTTVSRLSLFVVMVSLHLVASSPESDSTAYHTLRNSVLTGDPANQTIPTADALAEAGLYKDAIDLLQQYALPSDTLSSTSSSAKQEKRVAWRWSSGVDYYHLEDFDTAGMTIEEQRAYERLTETPLSLWTRLAATVTPWDSTAASLHPELYISERKGRFETALRYLLPGGLFEYEPMVKAEKWFRSNASDSVFNPDTSQPSDMVGAAVRCSMGNHSREHRPLHFSLPLSIDWEHYRTDQPGYESFAEYRFRPSLELGEGLPPLRFSTEVQLEDYYRDSSDYLDVIRWSGRAEGTFRNGSTHGFAAVAWLGDRYLHEGLRSRSSLPSTIDRFEGTFNGRHAFSSRLTARLRLRGIYEKEAAYDTIPALSGRELLVVPGAEVSFLEQRLTIGPDLQWERRFAMPYKENHYIWEGRNALEPGLRFGWSNAPVEAAVRAAFRYEHIDPEFEHTFDNRSFRVNCEFSVLPLQFLSLDGVMEYQYRRYVSFRANNRRSENLTVSVNATVRW
jgi:hypothetical protein